MTKSQLKGHQAKWAQLRTELANNVGRWDKFCGSESGTSGYHEALTRMPERYPYRGTVSSDISPLVKGGVIVGGAVVIGGVALIAGPAIAGGAAVAGVAAVALN